MQYLWAFYGPHQPGSDVAPVDFTWEREWRIKVKDSGLRIVLLEDRWKTPKGSIIVERDVDVQRVRDEALALERQHGEDYDWATRIQIISLETAERMIQDGRYEYARLDTWPE